MTNFPFADMITKAEMNLGGIWVDVTSRVLLDGGAGVRVRNGLGSEDIDRGTPAEFEFTLDNTDGAFSPRNALSPYTNLLKLGLQVRVSYNVGAGLSQRAQGEVYEFKPTLRPDAIKAMKISAVSPERRVLTGAKPVASPLYSSTVGARPAIYIPLEDAVATVHPQIAFGSGKVNFPGTINWASNSDLPGSKPLPTLTTSSYFHVVVDVTKFSQQRWQVEFWMLIPSAPAALTTMMRVYGAGSTAFVDYRQGATSYELTGFNMDGTTAWTTGGFSNGLEIGRWRRVRMMAQQNGTVVNFQLVTQNADLSSGSVISVAPTAIVGAPASCAIIGNQAAMPAISFGHFMVWDKYNYSASDIAGNAFSSEWPSVRWVRVLGELGYPDAQYRHGGGIVSLMGPQSTNNPETILQEAVDVNHAFVDTDKLGRIRHTNATYMANQVDADQSPDITFDYAAGTIYDLQVVDHDTVLWNEVTASLGSGGQSITVQQDLGRYNVSDPPVGIGRRGKPFSFNIADQTDLADHAYWELRRGVVDKPTVLALVIRFERARNNATLQTLLAAWPALDTGAWVRIANPPDHVGQDDLDIIMLGFEEQWTQKTFQVTIYGRPTTDYKIHRVEVGDERIDSDSTRLLHALSTSETSVRVWDTFDYYFPVNWGHRDGNYLIRCGGQIEDMNVTAVSTTSGSFVAAGTAAHADNASVVPGLPAGIQKGDALLLLSAIRNTAATVAGASNPGGWVELVNLGNVGMYLQIWDGSFSAPTAAFVGGSAGDSCSAQIAAFRNVAPRMLGEAATQTNGSAQNIASALLTGQVIKRTKPMAIFAGWKQDDLTSAASPAGFTQIGAPSTTLGNDQSLVWYYNFMGESFDLGNPTAVITGGAAAISKSMVFALDTNVQILTVTRAVNGISLGHNPNEEVHVKFPIYQSLF